MEEPKRKRKNKKIDLKTPKSLEPSIAFLENPFVIENGFPVFKIAISMDTAAFEIELEELLAGEGLKQFKFAINNYYRFSEQHILASFYTEP